MVTGTMKCRICGKEYEACQNIKRVEGVFRWQSVACCTEHGAEYLAQIRASRAKTAVAEEPTPVAETAAVSEVELQKPAKKTAAKRSTKKKAQVTE